MTAFLFAGQGVELPWVAADVLASRAVTSLIAVASETTGVDVARLLASGGRELARPEVMQPAMIAVCLGVNRLLTEAGVRPTIVLGHSLGELAAWAAAGGITSEDAVVVAATRGRLMAREAARHPGGMLRVIGDRESCERALTAGASAGAIGLGAHNAVDEWIVSGDDAALAHVASRFAATRLPVAGAWHSPAMAGAVTELATALESLPRRSLRARMVHNRDGRIVDAASTPTRLAGQLVRPIRWVACLDTLVGAGTRRMIAVGPGKMLRGLVRRHLGDQLPFEIVDSLATVAAAAERSAHEVA